VNDILSLRRELRYPYYNNVVAVLYHQLQDLQMAVDETYKIILRNMEKLEEAAKRALGRYPERREPYSCTHRSRPVHRECNVEFAYCAIRSGSQCS
jgi:hypothetical protein